MLDCNRKLNNVNKMINTHKQFGIPMGMQLRNGKVLKDTKENKTPHDISDKVTGIATAHISMSENPQTPKRNKNTVRPALTPMENRILLGTEGTPVKSWYTLHSPEQNHEVKALLSSVEWMDGIF